MISKWSDAITVDYRVYLEPLLASACDHQAEKTGLRTRSKYIRSLVIRGLKQDKYPLEKLSNKFNNLDSGVSYKK